MIRILRPETISFTATIREDELRERMAMEVLEQIGGLDESGKPLRGITTKVRRGPKGGYTIDVSGPMPARVMLPGSNQP